MGTYSGYYSRREIRDELTKNGTYRSCWVGNHLWIEYPAEASTCGVPFIGLALVERYGPEDWAYKPMDETSGPYTPTCPKSVLERVPVPPASAVGDMAHKWALEFRARCYEHHAHEARKRARRKLTR